MITIGFRLGMMDQLIQRLPNSEEHGVLQTDYVLEVLKRAEANFETINEQEIEQLFCCLRGLNLLSHLYFQVSPHDYQLNYRFLFKKFGQPRRVVWF